MDEKSLADLLSLFSSGAAEDEADKGKDSSSEQNRNLMELLKAAAGQLEGPVRLALSEFLDGRGTLHESTRSAITRGGKSAAEEVADLLKTRFKLSPALAALIAGLLVKLLPATGKKTSKRKAARKTTRRKTKPKTASSRKRKPGVTRAKKTTARKKASVKKPAAKKKSSTRARKKPTTRARIMKEPMASSSGRMP